MKRLIGACLTALLLLCLCPALAQELAGMTVVDAQGSLTLYADAATGEIAVADARSGCLWRSNPAEDDPKAKGVHKTTLQSQVTIGFSSDRGTALTAISQVDSFKKDGFSMELVGGEAVATYDFPKQEISLKVHYALKNGGLEVTVPVEETSSYGPNTLTSVTVLPAFGAGGPEETGYLLVPDGSGALIRFNNGVTAMNEYRANVYGRDPSVTGQVGLKTTSPSARTYEQTVRMPVFGISKGDHGFLAVITENDSKAVIHAKVSNLSSYNTVYSEFELLNSGSVVMNKKEFGQSITGISERKGLTGGVYTVRYYFLSGEAESSYAGMAKTYREYLLAEKGLEKRVQDGSYPLYLDLYGYVDKVAQVLGVPYNKAVPLTTLSDVREIVSAMGDAQTVVRYRQYLSGNAFGKIPDSAAIEGKLGTQAQLTQLAADMAAEGNALFPDVDMVNIYKTGRGFRALYDAVLAPVNSPQMQYQFSYGANTVNATIAPWYLLSPMKYSFFYGRYFDSYAALKTGNVSLSALGSVLTADNRTDGMGRQAAQAEVVSVLAQAGERLGSVMIDGGNAYAAAKATHVVKSPANSSQFTLCDEAVPFWQIVFHGYVSYSLSPSNQTGDVQKMTLKCLESGASPMFVLVGENQQELMDSRMPEVYSGDWRGWQATVLSQYGQLRAVLEKLSGQEITGHEILSEYVRRTDYGPVSVYVNYGEEPQTVDGVTVAAQGYTVKEGR